MMKIILSILLLIGTMFAQKPSYTLQSDERIIKKGTSAYWNSNYIWVLEGDLIIERGASLEIAPGTTIKFKANTDVTRTGKEKNKAEIIVYGELIAQGEPSLNKFITFTSDAGDGQERSGDWYGIVIYKNASGSNTRIKNVNVQYAYRGISCIGSSPYINNNRILYSFNSGIYLSKSNAIIESNIIQSNFYAGIEIRFNSKPKIYQNNINENEYGVMVYDSSEPSLGNKTNNKGSNSISNNFQFDIYNASSKDIMAIKNSWTFINTDSIRKNIFDGNDNGQYGRVTFLPISEITSAQLELENIQSQVVSPAIASTQGGSSGRQPARSNPTPARTTPTTQNTTTQPQTSNQSNTTTDNQETKKEDVKEVVEPPPQTRDAQPQQQPVEEETNEDDFYQKSLDVPYLKFALDPGTGQVIQKAKPDYAGAVAQLNIRGRVIFRLIIDKDGNVKEASILRSANNLLEEPALEAARKFKFTPGKVQGQVV
jgi:TonB family protein